MSSRRFAGVAFVQSFAIFLWSAFVQFSEDRVLLASHACRNDILCWRFGE
jgi:hypothetical protein